MGRRLAVLGVLVGFAACGGAMLPQLTPGQIQWAGQQWADMEDGRLAEARLLYVTRCSGCHNLILPATHDLGKWKKALDEMALKAKLNDFQREEIWRYLQTAKSAPAVDTTLEKAGRR